ncbi:DUF72 domain-containing protein [uncultured Enterovirga sp.]|uniref:DUF72 domain-containing protein n=1 Tax=uncultured Enterovirga sp. TaxID=2026352 RepID=UPI0035CC3209
MSHDLRIGTAGWAIPRAVADRFAETGNSLARYAGRFGAAEINSSFHRPHRPGTYAGWAASVPDGFRFAVKVPKTVTHGLKLVDAGAELERFVGVIQNLGPKLGPLLVQLPASLGFDEAVAECFFRQLRDLCPGPIVCEPRHPTWFDEPADHMLRDLGVARVAADPVRTGTSAEPGGWPGLVYIRLHGAPRMYYSDYVSDYLSGLAERLRGATVETWCMFDNTASGAACANALDLLAILDARPTDGA